jgi:hypothetical protein
MENLQELTYAELSDELNKVIEGHKGGGPSDPLDAYGIKLCEEVLRRAKLMVDSLSLESDY